MNQGNIVITLDGVSFKDTERCRQMIHKMFESGVFNVRNGKAILNFDNYGLLADIEVSMKTWSRKFDKEPIPELNSFSQFKIEMTDRDNSSVAKRV